MSTTKQSKSLMSKKRFFDIETAIKDRLNDDDAVSDIMKIISDIMNYDPNLSTYNETQAKQIRAYRNKLKQMGITTRGTLKDMP